MLWSAGCSLLRAEGFSCSFCVLYGGLRITKLQYLIKKISKFFSALNFWHAYPGFRTGSGSGSAIRKNGGSGFALNHCGSTTLSTGTCWTASWRRQMFRRPCPRSGVFSPAGPGRKRHQPHLEWVKTLPAQSN
jgi:hypothetical protein